MDFVYHHSLNIHFYFLFFVQAVKNHEYLDPPMKMVILQP